MKIYEYEYGKSTGLGSSVIALGLFDGVHAGHRSLIKSAKAAADKNGLPLAVFTFSLDSLVKGGGALYTDSEKHRILEKLGVNAIILADFSAISSISAEDFIYTSLIKDMSCSIAVAGFDFAFGANRVGNTELLKSELERAGKECLIENEVKLEGEKISTSRIKALLAKGNIKEANELLTEPYFICGKVTAGDGRGRSLGFPTINTEFCYGTPLRHGVYEASIELDGVNYKAITNVGSCPTFKERQVHAETFVLGYKGEIYGHTGRIKLLDFLRDEKKFDSKDELIMQINIDINKILEKDG